jgi:hypothetical protein
VSTSRTLNFADATPRQTRLLSATKNEAAKLGHTLKDTWWGNAHGFRTICSRCGKVAGVTFSRNTTRGDALRDKCPDDMLVEKHLGTKPEQPVLDTLTAEHVCG